MKTVISALALLAVLSSAPVMAEQAKVVFSQIGISDTVHTALPPDAAHYQNPILPGFYPDPSIVRVKDDYYLINSSFAYYPGIPVWHSKDLVHWQQIGNAIDRPNMLDFSGLSTSRGVFAPAISYHDGTFYIVNTCVDCKGNFIITAKDPAGPWSDPTWLPFGGIDPSIFWDDDGKAWITYNEAPEGQTLYNGHRALWLQQFDPATRTMVGPRKVIVNGGVDISQKPVWIEGPHIYKKDGHYYLMAAEGGTSEGHSEVIFRSDNVTGPYVPHTDNPILTQRDLDPNRHDPITSSGHADLVETQSGDWYAVFLATRPYEGGLYNTGRETFMLPVKWKDGWPIILDHKTAIPTRVPVPNLPAWSPSRGGNMMHWIGVRNAKAPVYTLDAQSNFVLQATPEPLGDVTSHPSFIGVRQTQAIMGFDTTLTYTPLTEGDRAGIVALQSDDFYIFYGLAQKDGKTVLEITRRSGANDPRDGVVIATTSAPAGPLALHMAIDGGKAKFTYGNAPHDKIMAENVDVTNLSTAKAGGFVGTIIGLYAYGQK